MSEKEELIEMLQKPNVQVIRGEDGVTWTCWDPDSSKSPKEQDCEKTDEVKYDRGFGG